MKKIVEWMSVLALLREYPLGVKYFLLFTSLCVVVCGVLLIWFAPGSVTQPDKESTASQQVSVQDASNVVINQAGRDLILGKSTELTPELMQLLREIKSSQEEFTRLLADSTKDIQAGTVEAQKVRISKFNERTRAEKLPKEVVRLIDEASNGLSMAAAAANSVAANRPKRDQTIDNLKATCKAIQSAMGLTDLGRTGQVAFAVIALPNLRSNSAVLQQVETNAYWAGVRILVYFAENHEGRPLTKESHFLVGESEGGTRLAALVEDTFKTNRFDVGGSNEKQLVALAVEKIRPELKRLSDKLAPEVETLKYR
jgi:hypothetical protein